VIATNMTLARCNDLPEGSPGTLVEAAADKTIANEVVPICRVLTEHGCPIAPRTFWAWKRRAPSKRELSDLVLSEVLAGIYEPDEHGRRNRNRCTGR
jgi:hypothetical protein